VIFELRAYPAAEADIHVAGLYGTTERRALPGFVVSERFSAACERRALPDLIVCGSAPHHCEAATFQSNQSQNLAAA
jgi:hypothetical protein